MALLCYHETMTVDVKEQQRIASELQAVGITGAGLKRTEARKLYMMLHPDEHVMGAIRGRYKGDGAMFVATNRRMLLLNYKPLFHNNDEISYDVLAGVTYNPEGLYAGVDIHTRMGDFPFRYVNKKSAKKLVEYLEHKHLEVSNYQKSNGAGTPTSTPIAKQLTPEGRIFLASHNIGVLGSINKDGGINGAVVYYVLGADSSLYMVTKQQTAKAQNIRTNSQVAFTVYDEQARATMQIRGVATVEKNAGKAGEIVQHIIKPHLYNLQLAWPPITQLIAGPYQVIQISMTDAKYTNFNQ